MPGEVDLHGLYVKESITYTDQSIAEARARGDKEVRLIVGSYNSFLYFEERGKELTVWHRFACAGKGIHSPNQAAKLKPAIEEFMQK
jgi:hypothetical protein